MAWQPRSENWMSDKEIEECYTVFISFDSDGDEALTVPELIQLMEYIEKYNESFKTTDMLNKIDPNDSGLIEFQEFLFLLHLTSCDKNKVVDAAFKILDPTGDGVISTDSLKEACSKLGVKITDNEITSMIKEADPEGDGTLDFKELKTQVEEIIRLTPPVKTPHINWKSGKPLDQAPQAPNTWFSPRTRNWKVEPRVYNTRFNFDLSQKQYPRCRRDTT